MTDSRSAPSVAFAVIEIHFTEVFSGQGAQLLIPDQDPITLTLQTRFQTGLAHVETLELSDGKEVHLKLDEPDLEATITVDATRPFVVVGLQEDRLSVTYEVTTPGYL